MYICRKKRKQEEEGSRNLSHVYLQEEEEARQEEEECSRYLSHVHLQDTLLEVTQLCPDVIVHLASRRHMLCGDYDAVPFHQPAPADSSSTWFLSLFLFLCFCCFWSVSCCASVMLPLQIVPLHVVPKESHRCCLWGFRHMRGTEHLCIADGQQTSTQLIIPDT